MLPTTPIDTAHSAAAPAVTLMDRLKAETRRAHDATEAIPYSGAILERRLPRERFVAQLVAYRGIHGALDHALASSTDPVVGAVWTDAMRKTSLLDADVEFFAPSADALPPDAVAATDAFVARITELERTDPVSLLGFLYVLEGSTLGATILRGHLAAAYGLEDGRGLAYQSPYGPSPMPQWMGFKVRMNAAVVDPAAQGRVVEAASEAFSRIGDLLRALSSGLDR